MNFLKIIGTGLVGAVLGTGLVAIIDEINESLMEDKTFEAEMALDELAQAQHLDLADFYQKHRRQMSTETRRLFENRLRTRPQEGA